MCFHVFVFNMYSWVLHTATCCLTVPHYVQATSAPNIIYHLLFSCYNQLFYKLHPLSYIVLVRIIIPAELRIVQHEAA